MDQNRGLLRRAQIFCNFLPGNRFQRPPWNFILHHTTLHHTAPHHTTLHYTNCIALHCITLHYITLHSLHHHECNCNYTTLITLHHNYNSTTLQLQLQLHYTTLHPAVVGEVTDQVTTAPIAATPKKTQPQPPFGPSVDSLCHP